MRALLTTDIWREAVKRRDSMITERQSNTDQVVRGNLCTAGAACTRLSPVRSRRGHCSHLRRRVARSRIWRRWARTASVHGRGLVPRGYSSVPISMTTA